MLTFCFVLNVNAISFVSARDFLVSDDKFPTCFPPPHTRTISYDSYRPSNFSHEEVLSSLQNLNSSKTPGPDNLHPRILKQCANELAPSLCLIFNKSLCTGKLPSDWKQANITPVFKKGSKALVPNYRQISLLSIVSKLCERCVLRNLLSKLSHLLTSAQHGFVRGRTWLRSCCQFFTTWEPRLMLATK